MVRATARAAVARLAPELTAPARVLAEPGPGDDPLVLYLGCATQYGALADLRAGLIAHLERLRTFDATGDGADR